MKRLTHILADLLIVVGLISFLPPKASAYTLVLGGPGMPGFYGWEDYNFQGTGGIVDADVFFAVFAPGQQYNPYPSLYTYVYLAKNNPTARPTPVNTFSVGIGPGVFPTIANSGSYKANPDIWGSPGLAPAGAPQPPFFVSDDSGWSAWVIPTPTSIISFLGIPQGTNSETIFYTSTLAPTFVTASLQDGGSSQRKYVPGPWIIPEPTSMLLLGMGILGVFGLRRKKA